MSVISVRDAWWSRYGPLDLSQGLLGAVLNPFWQTHRQAFPYRSIKTLLADAAWPKHYEYVGDYPDASALGWTKEVQGVTHDASHWFFTQNPDDQPRLWKFPLYHDLAAKVEGADPNKGILITGLPASLHGYHHFGDLDYYQGHLYISLQGKGRPPKIVVYDAQTLDFVAAADLPGPGGGAWCAVNPINGFLYGSRFYELEENPTELTLSVYEPTFQESTFKLTYLGEIELFDANGAKIVLKRLQGGVFSQRGHLYLVSDNQDAVAQGGIWGFEMVRGRRTFHHSVSYLPDFPDYEELEGITIWDLDATGAPNIGGQIHLIMLDNDAGDNDDIYLKHFRVNAVDRDKV